METAIVTGASSGIGRAIAEKLVKRGFLVHGMARHFEPASDEASHITPECVANAVEVVLNQRPGTVITEIILKPERAKIDSK